jgi:hypothetical protein
MENMEPKILWRPKFEFARKINKKNNEQDGFEQNALGPIKAFFNLFHAQKSTAPL